MGLAIVVVLMATVFSLPQFGGEDVLPTMRSPNATG